MSANPLLDQILSGQNRQLQVLAASGLVPLPPEQLVPIQVGLTRSPDPEIASKAAEALRSLDPGIAGDYLAHGAGRTELAYFAAHVDQPDVLMAILRRKDTPRQILLDLAPSLSPDLQEILVLRQDAILDEPRIVLELERNPQLTSYAKRRLWEYREHLLPKEALPPRTEEEIAQEAEAITEDEIKEAVEEITGEKQAVLDLHRLKDSEIRQLPVPMRMKVARGAPVQVRSVLIRDTNAQVALAVMYGNNLTDQEVEMIAASRSVRDEVLAEIPKKREWIQKYTVVKSLVKNPRTQLATAVKLVPRLSVKDLRELSKDKNVPDGVRSTAWRLYQAKRH